MLRGGTQYGIAPYFHTPNSLHHWPFSHQSLLHPAQVISQAMSPPAVFINKKSLAAGLALLLSCRLINWFY